MTMNSFKVGNKQMKEETNKQTNKQCNLDFDPNCDVVGGGFRCSTDKANGLICTTAQHTMNTHTCQHLVALKQDHKEER